MSVFQPRDDNRLSKKFEGVVSDVEGQSDSEEEDETKDEGTIEVWTKADYEQLIEKIRGALPKKDVKKAKSALQHINWKEIQIRQHSPEEIQRVALSLVAKVRNFRTLGEVLNDVPEVVDKILSADKPKVPLTAYALFMKEYIPQCSNTKDAFKTASKTFQELSAKKKKQYEDTAAKLKEEYHKKLDKFYQEHPDLAPPPKPSKTSRAGRTKSSGVQLKRERNRTPFNLFYESRMEVVPTITLQLCRQEWEELAVKDKLPFIRKSFETQDDTKLLNKKEQELLAQFQGKPEFVGRSAYDYFHRQNKSKYDDLPGKERKQKVDNEYQQLSERQKLDLKVAFLAARDNYILQYQKYIKELPEDKQKAEIEYLRSISSSGAGKKDKTLTARKEKKSKDEDHYPGSTDEDPPAAESTTIKKSAKEKKHSKKKLAEVPPPVQESEPEDADEDVQEETVAIAAMPSPTKKSRMMEPPTVSPKKAVASTPKPVEDKKKSKKKLDMASSSGEEESSASTSQTNGRKRQTPEELATPEDDTGKKSKKKAKKDEEEEKPKVPMKEPERPPTVLEEFYRQRVYKGKVGKHKESFANLSAAKKREIKEQMNLAQKKYIEEFERFLKSLPRDQIRLYIQKVNSKRTSAPAKEEDDEEEGSTETGSSGSDEDDDE